MTFPHHENEIAQSCSAIKKNSNPNEFCNYWFHNGFVTYNGEKMSKSIGNIQLVHDILKRYDGKVIRLSLLSAHYRQPLNWNEKILQQSKQTLSRIFKNLERIKINSLNNLQIEKNEFYEDFLATLFDDLNTPKAFSIINKYLNMIEKASTQNAGKIHQAIDKGLDLLGINILNSREDMTENDTIKKLIQERDSARKNKDFTKADEIREKLKKINIEIEDTKEGTLWTKIK